MTFSSTSFNYLHGVDGANLDRDMKTTFSTLSQIDTTAVKAPAFGASFALDGGVVAVTGSKFVQTKLTSITAVIVSLDGGQGVPLNRWVTANRAPSPAGGLQIWVWAPTSSSDNTPVAAPGPLNVNWLAIGSAATTA